MKKYNSSFISRNSKCVTPGCWTKAVKSLSPKPRSRATRSHLVFFSYHKPKAKIRCSCRWRTALIVLATDQRPNIVYDRENKCLFHTPSTSQPKAHCCFLQCILLFSSLRDGSSWAEPVRSYIPLFLSHFPCKNSTLRITRYLKRKFLLLGLFQLTTNRGSRE